MDPKYTHSVNEHRLAEGLVEPLLAFVKDDAFTNSDTTLTYAQAIARFSVGTSNRRMGRVIDAVSRILQARGWPPAATAGIAAYVVSDGRGRPGPGWDALWNMNAEDARAEARAHVREQALRD